MNVPNAQDDAAMQEALRRVLRPLADWVIARGVPYAAVDEVLRAMLVEAAYAAYPDLPPHRRASRVTATTGLHRREVTRLLKTESLPPPRPSRANQIFSKWRSLPQYDTGGEGARTIPRTGPEPSFEALARSVTRDVHPRTLLEELVRLGLVEADEGKDTVALKRELFTPLGDDAELLTLLGHNVGDHLAAAVANVSTGTGVHFERAIYADGLLMESALQLRPRIAERWRAVVAEMVPELQSMIDRDDGRDPAAEQRVRIGMYSYYAPSPKEPPQELAAPAAPAPVAPVRRGRRRASKTAGDGDGG